MRVSWFVPLRFPRLTRYDAMPASVWIRCLQLLPYLRTHGITSELNPGRPRGDVAVLVRRLDDVALEIARAARARGATVVLDLCVDYFDATPLTPEGYGVTPAQVERCLRLCALADVVTTASAFIADRARAHHPNVRYLADSIDLAHFRHRRPPVRAGRPPRAIWCGVAVKAGELESALPALAAAEIPLTIVSDRRPTLPYPFTFVRWRWRTAPRTLLGGDFCFAPRPVDSPYNHGHSHFKVGVFLAQGVPVLASRVPSYEEVVLDGVTGRLVDSMDGWPAALAEVRNDPTVLDRWSAATRAAMAPYATDVIARCYADTFRTCRDTTGKR